jgi:integrase
LKDLAEYIAIGGLRHREIEIDTPVESFERALGSKSPSRYWSQVMRWDRQNSLILYDTGYRIRDLLREKLVFPDTERRRIMRRQGVKLADRLVYEFALWEHRGRPWNLARVLIQAAEHLILWIYAKNRQFQPYTDKWLFYHLETGAVPESKHLSVLKRPFTEGIRSAKDARSVRADLLGLADKLGVELEYRTVRELRAEEEKNYLMASEKTRHFLSW